MGTKVISSIVKLIDVVLLHFLLLVEKACLDADNNMELEGKQVQISDQCR